MRGMDTKTHAQPAAPISRTTLMGAAGVIAAALPAVAIGAQPDAGLFHAEAEHKRLTQLGMLATRAAEQRGASGGDIDAAGEFYYAQRDTYDDFITEAPPLTHAGAAVKLRHLMTVLQVGERHDGADWRGVGQVVAFLEGQA